MNLITWVNKSFCIILVHAALQCIYLMTELVQAIEGT